MSLPRILLPSFAAVFAFVAPVFAEEKSSSGVLIEHEIRALRESIDGQAAQITALRQAVQQLAEALKKGDSEAPAAPAPAPPPAAEKPKPPAPEPPSTAEAPRAEPANPAGPQHTVAKGETLTSIAKHYNISTAELYKANKITDDRKLQIGQVLIIPTTKPSDRPTDKKETP